MQGCVRPARHEPWPTTTTLTARRPFVFHGEIYARVTLFGEATRRTDVIVAGQGTASRGCALLRG